MTKYDDLFNPYKKTRHLINAQGAYRGKKLKPGQHTGMSREDDRMKGNLLLKRNSRFRWLRADLSKGVNMKVIALKVTRPNPQKMPFEHLTFKRIESMLTR